MNDIKRLRRSGEVGVAADIALDFMQQLVVPIKLGGEHAQCLVEDGFRDVEAEVASGGLVKEESGETTEVQAGNIDVGVCGNAGHALYRPGSSLCEL